MRVRVIFPLLILLLFLIKKGYPSRALKYFLFLLANKIIFKPKKFITYESMPNKINETLLTSDNILIDACLYNSYRCPSYNDSTIFLYSHGNSGNIQLVAMTNTIKYLSKYGSVFIYDYRGYGMSTGKPSDNGMFIDSLTVWNFLVNEKHVCPQNIILFGHSLGTSVTANLMLNILKINNESPTKYPRALILQNPFFSMYRLIDEHLPIIGSYIRSYIVSEFNTNLFFEQIDSWINNIKINIIHSYDDELISYKHSIDLQKLIKNNQCSLFLVPGNHNIPIYDKSVDEMIIHIANNK